MKNIMAVDVGYGRIKALSSNKQLDFPSVVGPWREIRYKNEVATSPYLSQLAVEYMGQKMFLGEMAYRQSKAKMDMSIDRFCRAEGMALLLAAIALLGSGNHISCDLVTGLPINSFNDLRKKYSQIIKGTHFIKFLDASETGRGYHITVEKCKVLPQPLGTIFDLILDEAGNLVNRELADSRLAVLDVGANTLDLCRVDSLEFIDRESTSYSDLGVFECYRQLSMEIYNAFRIEIPPEEIEPYVSNNALKIGGRFHSIAHLKDKVYAEAAEKIVSRAENVWRNMWQLDKIIISGGGAEVFGQFIARALNKPQQVEISQHGTFSNVRGYLKLGRKAWSK